MSYILDALKKSEKERRRGTVPGVHTVQEVIIHEPRSRPVWPYIVITAIAVNMVIIGFWLTLRTPQKKMLGGHDGPVIETGMNTHTMTPAVSRPTSSVGHIQGASQVKGADTVRHDVPSPQKTIIADTAAKGVKPEPQQQENLSVQTAPSVSSPSEPHPLPARQQPEDRVYQLKELPEHIRKGLPDFSVSAFLYSERPSSRMARVNNVMMKEGQNLTSDLKLLEILPDGLVFTFQKYRFFVRVQ